MSPMKKKANTLLEGFGLVCAISVLCRLRIYTVWSEYERDNSFGRLDDVKKEGEGTWVAYPQLGYCKGRFEQQWAWWDHERDASPVIRPDSSRAFISSFPQRVQDGLGHMSELVSWELKAARLLNATYIHRDAHYRSLGNDVDGYFTWNRLSENRTAFLEKNCNGTVFTSDECRGNRSRCMGLSSFNKRFSSMVEVPVSMLRCSMTNESPKRAKRCGLEAFLRRHNDTRILFQLDASTCFWRNFARWEFPELPWLSNRYWSREHETFDMDHRRLHIAVHIRRGDILFSNTSNGRYRLYSDEQIATVLQAAVRTIDAEESQLRPLYEVHIFSQGANKKGANVGGNHKLSLYPGGYVNEDGVEQSHDYWQKRIERALPWQLASRVHVTMRISEDTLKSISTMASADLFVASKSTLGNSLVRAIARGVQIQGVPQESDFSNVVAYPSAKWLKPDRDFEHMLSKAWRRYKSAFASCPIVEE